MAHAPLIPNAWQVPDEFRRRLGSTVGRQRAMQSEGHLLLVLHLVPEADQDSRHGVLFHRDAEGTWRASNGDRGNVALVNHLDDFTERIDRYDVQEQQAHQAAQYLPLLEGLVPLVRTTRHLHEVLEEARKALPDDRNMIDCRDRAYEISRRAELLLEEAKTSMEVAVVRRAEEQAAASHRMLVSAHRLNVLAALFFPFGTLGAVFGTTLTENWGWSQDVTAFKYFIMGGCIAGPLLALFISRPAK